jgi:hypothetical protein
MRTTKDVTRTVVVTVAEVQLISLAGDTPEVKAETHIFEDSKLSKEQVTKNLLKTTGADAIKVNSVAYKNYTYACDKDTFFANARIIAIDGAEVFPVAPADDNTAQEPATDTPE